MSLKAIPLRNPALTINEDEEAPTIVNPLDGHIWVTNVVGRHVIELCDGERTVEDIVSRVADEYEEVPREEIQGHVQEFLDLASKKGMIEWKKAPSSL